MPEESLKQAHGDGDDDEIIEEEPQKLDLRKYLGSSDHNLSDAFEKIMIAYKGGEDVKKELEKVKDERIALLRVAIRVISGDESIEHLKMSKNNLAYYFIKLLLEMDWMDVFRKLIVDSYDRKIKHPLPLLAGFNRMYAEDKTKLLEYINEMLTDLKNEEVVSLVAEMHNKELMEDTKKLVKYLAHDDIGDNKKNSVYALSLVANNDPEIKRLFKNMLKSNNEESVEIVLQALLLGEVFDSEINETLKEIKGNIVNPGLLAMISRILKKGEK